MKKNPTNCVKEGFTHKYPGIHNPASSMSYKSGVEKCVQLGLS